MLPFQNLRASLPQYPVGSPAHMVQHSASSSPSQIRHPQQLALQLGNSFLTLTLGLNCTRNGTASLAAHLEVKVARGPMLALRKAVSVVGAVLCPSSHYPATAPNNQSLSSSISLPVQSRQQLTQMTDCLQKPQGASIDHDRDSVVEVSRGDADQSGDELDSSSDSLQSAADSGPKSATWDCLTCSDTEEVAINSATGKNVLEESICPLAALLRAASGWRPS